jgi:hypothetical protein
MGVIHHGAVQTGAAQQARYRGAAWGVLTAVAAVRHGLAQSGSVRYDPRAADWGAVLVPY